MRSDWNKEAKNKELWNEETKNSYMSALVVFVYFSTLTNTLLVIEQWDNVSDIYNVFI